jgi:hypothetical protein
MDSFTLCILCECLWSLPVVFAAPAVHFTWCYCGTKNNLYCWISIGLLLVSWPFYHITWQFESCSTLSDLQRNRSSHFKVIWQCFGAIYYNLIWFIPQNEWFRDNPSEHWHHRKYETHTVRLRESCWRFHKQKGSIKMFRNCRKWEIMTICFGDKAHIYKDSW